ncbi:MAG: hypothetical protein U0V74_17715 [Chitinophagales bacterium]
MELLIALLTFFGISFEIGGNQAKIDWNDPELASKIQNTSEYQDYIKYGGTDVFDAEGMPAVWVTVTEPKN